MGNWTKHDYDDRANWDDITSGPGCYVVYLDGELVYIGQSVNVWLRMLNHEFGYRQYSTFIQTPWGNGKNLLVKVKRSRRYGDWAMAELRLIRRLQPKFNCVGSVRKRKAKVA